MQIILSPIGSRAGRRIACIVSGLATLASACGRSPSEPDPADVEGQFEAFHAAFASVYPYFEYKKVDWQAAGATFRPLASRAPSTDSLVRILTAMVAPLRDVHLAFYNPAGVRIATASDRRPSNFDAARWQGAVTAAGWKQRARNLGTARFGDVGYIAIGSWSPNDFTRADLDAALDALRDARALILDVRANGGGNDALAFELAGRFSAAPIAAGTVRFRSGAGLGAPQSRSVAPRGPWTWTKPVVLLIGGRCYSSNESFIGAMATLPHVTTMGDTTGGGSGNPSERKLGSGWKYSLPRWIEYAPDGQIIEWQGLAPAVRVPFDTAGLAPGHDPVIAAAVSRLSSAR